MLSLRISLSNDCISLDFPTLLFLRESLLEILLGWISDATVLFLTKLVRKAGKLYFFLFF